jgi:bacteriophage CI repressor helix-turn-helix domain
MKDRLKELRKALHLTQQKLADKLGVKQNTIAQYEMGRNEPSDAVIVSICREFGVSEDWLRNGNGDMFIPMTRDEEIASFIGSVQADVDDTFKKRFISALAKLSTEEWKAIEHLMENMISEREQ